MTADCPGRAEAADPFLIDAGTAALMLHAAPWRRFVAVGDSGAAGVTEPLDGYATVSWFDRVAQCLRAVQPSFAALNLGTRDVLAAQVRQAQLGPAIAFAPDLAAVLSGGNDILRPQFDPAATRAEIAAVVTGLAGAGATVLLTGLFDITCSPHVPPKYRKMMRERIALLSDVIASIAADCGALYVDLPAHPAGSEAIYSSDGLHLNARGQAIAAAEMVRCLGRALAARAHDRPGRRLITAYPG